MTQSDGANLVLDAVKLGWYLAEVRGRNRPNPPAAIDGNMPDRSGHALPLNFERTAPELRIVSRDVLKALVGEFDVNIDPKSSTGFSAQVESISNDLIKGQVGWDVFAELMYRFDAHIQDTLAVDSDDQWCAYQLGRGLAEIYWALDPSTSNNPSDVPINTPPSATSWAFLLGDARRDELSRLLGRLTSHLNHFTPPAISGSLIIWNKVALDAKWLEQEIPASASSGPLGAIDCLHLQIRRWYELVILSQDPTTLVSPAQRLRNWQAAFRVVSAFLPQLALGLIFAAALTSSIWLAAAGLGSSTVSAVTGVVGALGLSATTLQTKLKNSAQALGVRYREDTYTDLVAIAITIVPPQANKNGTWQTTKSSRLSLLRPNATNRAFASALKGRILTTAVGIKDS